MKIVPPKGLDREDGLQLLWQDGEIAFCRGWRVERDASPQPIFAMTPRSDPASAGVLDRLAHEYGLRDQLDEAWALRPLDLRREEGRALLVLSNPGGEPLSCLLGGRPMPIGAFLPLAIHIAGALGEVHGRGLIHKDVKPAHVIVDETTGAVRLTGFGLASLMPREHPELEPPDTISGTLAYMAPEQTGRMNRSVDSRSDLYALGVTFYEMLTGALPFAAADPMEWAHCHIARRPSPPTERVPGLPEAVSAIVMKLLAKAAEDRYQTAAGVVADLERCLARWRADGEIRPFRLGAGDVPAELRIPEKLYGRERDVETLVAALGRAASAGRTELVLVSGYSGIGKSSVVQELHKAMVAHGGLFAAGKFDQRRREVPYATLAQAFRTLVRQILAQSDEAVADWRAAILEAVAPNGRLLIKLIPELELVIGEQPECPRVGPEDAEHRFQLVWRQFIAVLARPEHPLVLFLDDLQWLDAATLKLLAHLVAHPEVRNVLFIGAYRDNEVGPAHSLKAALDDLRNAGAPVQDIVLEPLSRVDVARLISDTFNCDERSASLARLTHRKTSGNPFFVIQFLTTLWNEGLLTFDPREGRWTWDLERIEAKGYTDNVVDLVVERLKRLPDPARDVLGSFACLGNAVDLRILAMACAREEAEVEADLSAALREGLICRCGGAYLFLHDRIQEAAYSLIPEPLRAQTHLRIGRRLVAGLPEEALQDRIFEVANQLNSGAALISGGEERRRTAELNLLAGQRAKAATAYASALAYLTAGEDLLPRDSWARDYELTFALGVNRAECEHLTGAIEVAAARLSDLWARATRLTDFSAIACQRVAIQSTMDRQDLAVEACLAYLRKAGLDWTSNPSHEEVAREYDLMWRRIGERPIASLVDLPQMTDPDQRATVDVLNEMLVPASYSGRNLVALAASRMVNLSLQYGNTDASVFAYVVVADLLTVVFGNYSAGFQFGELSLALVDKPGTDRFKAWVYGAFAHSILAWRGRLRDSAEIAQRGFEIARERGDLTYAAYCRYAWTALLSVAGEPLAQVEQAAQLALASVREARVGLLVDIITTQLAFIRMLRGRTSRFGSFKDVEFDPGEIEQRIADDPNFALPDCLYWIRTMRAQVLAGDYAAALAAASRAEAGLHLVGLRYELADYHFYAALTHAGACAFSDRSHRLEALAVHCAQLEEWAEHCPENFEDRAALVGAEAARLEGRDLDAQRLYESAISAARSGGFIHNEALASELAANFYFDLGLDTNATAHLRQARACYAQWGAEGKVRQLDERHPGLAISENRSAVVTTGSPASQLDVVTAVKASQAISGEIELDRLIETLMSIAIQNAGADRGVLVLSRGNSLAIAAEARAAGDRITVTQGPSTLGEVALPASLLRYVMRAREDVLVDDTAKLHPYSDDPYFRDAPPRSILCVPLIKRTQLTGVLYLENAAAARAFTPERMEMLTLLASQAVISLENAGLYADLRDREAKIRRLFDTDIIGVIFWDQFSKATGANDAALHMLGYTRQELEAGALRWPANTPPEYRARGEQALNSLQASGRFEAHETELFRKDGSRLPVLIGGAYLEGFEDRGVAFLLDRSEAADAARRQKTLLDELNHRVKNTLATVQSLCAQTLRSANSAAAFQDEFEGRLAALSATHNALNQSGWQAVRLGLIVERVLAPYGPTAEPRFEISGDDVNLGPTSAIALGMAFHELATNALKYGALSTSAGRVRASWEVRAAGRLHIIWEESGGPEVQPPQRRGFGSRLIERNLGAQLRGAVSLEFLPQGVRCQMDADLDEVSRA